MVNNRTRLISGSLLAKNVLWNLAGMGLPLVAAVFSIPILVREIGPDRFGILSIAWVFVGYFSLFDLGLGRAVTKLVSESLGRGEFEQIAPTIWTAVLLMTGLGLIGALTVGLLTPWLVEDMLTIPSAFIPESRLCFYLLAVSIPFVIIATALRGVLEAYQRFDLVNVVRVPLGLLNFLGPVAVLPFSSNLAAMVAVIVVGRLVAMTVQFALCVRTVPALRKPRLAERQAMFRLLSFGGWMTATNIVGPLMMYFDRFLIGALASVAAVAYYSTSYEVVTRLWLMPVALVTVLFPAFSNASQQDEARPARMFASGLSTLYVAILIPILVIVTFAHEGLYLWLGPDFAAHGSIVLQLLAVGVLANSMAQVPFAMIQGYGRPDITAKLHLAELPLYLAGLWWLIQAHGIAGAAAAWTIRATVDAIAMFFVARWLAPTSTSYIQRFGALMTATGLLMALCANVDTLTQKSAAIALALIALISAVWLFLVPANDRQLVKSFVKKQIKHRSFG